MKYWHYLLIIAAFFVGLYIWKAGTLKNVPVVGPYLAQ